MKYLKKYFVIPSVLVLVTLVIVTVSTLPGFAADCSRGEQLYKQALSTKNPDKKLSLFRQSAKLCPTVPAFYMTGLTCMQLNRFSEAVKPLEEALKLDKNVAETYFVLGDAYLKLKRARESILLFKAGLALKKIPAYEKKLRETRSNVMGLDTNACSIQNALEQGMKYRSRGISVTPAIDVKVEFQLNKATLSETGKYNSHEIGKAIRYITTESKVTVTSPNSIGRFVFKFIGHTDSRGSRAANERLSRNRANAVKNFVVKQYGLSPDIISIEGKGNREPLVPNAQTEIEHAFNRRVEIEVTAY